MDSRVLAAAVVVALAVLGGLWAACSDDDGDSAAESGTPEASREISEDDALNVFYTEVARDGLFGRGDDLDVTAERLLYPDALEKAQGFGLPLYATIPGLGPFPELEGWYIEVHGEFYDYGGASPSPAADTPRRSGVAVGFVDDAGAVTYANRFVEE